MVQNQRPPWLPYP